MGRKEAVRELVTPKIHKREMTAFRHWNHDFSNYGFTTLYLLIFGDGEQTQDLAPTGKCSDTGLCLQAPNFPSLEEGLQSL